MGMPSHEASSERSDQREIHDLDYLTLPTQIAHILQELSASHTLVTVSVPGSNQLFTSSILSVDREAGEVLMDELNPREGHDLLVKKRQLRVNSRLKGVEVGFRGAVTKSHQAGGIAIYHVSLPKRLFYNQRRQYYRLVVGISPHVPVTLECAEGLLLHGQVHDISVGGIGARFTPSEDENVETGQRLENCAIELPDSGTISSALEICFVDRSSPSRQLKLGGRFLNLARADQQSISRFITSLERKRLKIRPKSG